ncbi:MAG: phosphoglucosamine mutase, partial [Acidobacteriota bacterium]
MILKKRSKQLFGTDGVRGQAGRYPLDPVTVRSLGSALGRHLQGRGRPLKVVIGYDTRQSSLPLCSQMVAGMRKEGTEAVVAGVIPTPGIAYLARTGPYGAGVVISASHNPYRDNGIKFFQADGTKLPDDDEAWLETQVLDAQPPAGPEPPGMETVATDSSLARGYMHHLGAIARQRGDLSGCRVVVDCANGAAAPITPDLMKGLGIEAVFMGNLPDGTNINTGCGSLHPQRRARTVVEQGVDMGLAMDGDADRCLVVDDTGRVLDGDFILYMAARDLKQRGLLNGCAVVATVMSNLWLEERLEAEGMKMLRTPVGDKYVLQEMLRGDHMLGGEQSGHVIFRHHATTGDGLLTGLIVLGIWKSDGRRLSQMVEGIHPCPQLLINVQVRQKPDLEDHPLLGPIL